MLVVEDFRNDCGGCGCHQERHQCRNRKCGKQDFAGEKGSRNGAVEDGGDAGAASARQKKRPAFASELEHFRHIGTDGGTGQGDRRLKSGGCAHADRESAGDDMGIGFAARQVAGSVGGRHNDSRQAFFIRPLVEKQPDDHDTSEDADCGNDGKNPHHPRKALGEQSCKVMAAVCKEFQKYCRGAGDDSDDNAQQKDIAFIAECAVDHSHEGVILNELFRE